MYDVVGCRSCGNLWIREGVADSATCPRCSKRYAVDRLRVLASGETIEAAREARSSLLADRSKHGDFVAGYAELEDTGGETGISDETYLDAFGIEIPEPANEPKLNKRQMIRSLLEELAHPTRERLIAKAAEHDIERQSVERMLDRLQKNGEIVREGNEYRVL